MSLPSSIGTSNAPCPACIGWASLQQTASVPWLDLHTVRNSRHAGLPESWQACCASKPTGALPDCPSRLVEIPPLNRQLLVLRTDEARVRRVPKEMGGPH